MHRRTDVRNFEPHRPIGSCVSAVVSGGGGFTTSLSFNTPTRDCRVGRTETPTGPAAVMAVVKVRQVR